MSRWWRSSLQQDCQRQQRCFNCNQVGHFAANCPWDPHCSLCRGWGHTKTQCANNYLAKVDSFGFGASCSQAEPNTARIPSRENFLTNRSNPNSAVSSSSSNFLNFKGVPQRRAGLKLTPLCFLLVHS